MIKYLKNYVELRTKVASFFPFLYTVAIYIYLFKIDYNYNWLIVILFLVAMLCLDMATTVLNHNAGMKDEKNVSPYDQKLLVDMKKLGIDMRFNKRVLYALVTLGIGIGVVIVLLSNIYVLGIGTICVFVAIIYSYGPLPLKNTFLGELASGFTMGMLIPLALIFALDQSIFIKLNNWQLTINLENVFIWFAVLLIPTFVIANIMLANNICDIEKDKDDGRITLPIIIGKMHSIFLWKLLYALVYLIIVFLIVVKILPIVSLLTLVTIPVVSRNCLEFSQNPVKSLTFKFAVKNLIIIMSSIIFTLVIGVVIK